MGRINMKDLERRRKDLKGRCVSQTWYRDKMNREGERISRYVTVAFSENSMSYIPGNVYKFGIVGCFEI